MSGCSLLGALVGGDVPEERQRSASETAKRQVDGRSLLKCVGECQFPLIKRVCA